MRYLTPENIMYDSNGVVYIGNSSYNDIVDKKTEWKRWGAPELIKGEVREADEQTVLFSVGMMIYGTLTAEIPFPKKN
jgi:serine/threonine protein kinase